MDELVASPNTPIRLRRACEHNRLERQFLIEAYEHLVMLIVPEESRRNQESNFATNQASVENAYACGACVVELEGAN
jgi:hypothetical protein